MRVLPLTLALSPLVLALGLAPAAAPPKVLFRDITDEAGVTFTHHSAPEKKYIIESMSGGIALIDYNNDGLLDIYITDSLTVDTATKPLTSHSALYKNLGNGKFVDVADQAGVAHPGWAMGACVADVDGDGWQDLYVTSFGKNHLYHNNRDGTFTDIAEKAGVTGGGWSAGCGFADYDHDGRLDLFVSRYIKVDLANLPEFGKGKTCEFRGIPVQCGPRGLPGETDFLYHNDGNGHFTEVGEKAGVSDPKGYPGLGVSWLDFNRDGWPDLFVANDSTPNYLYENQKDGTFKEVAFPMGVAVSEDGAEQGSMGVAVGDYDNDGILDLFVTTFAEEYYPLRHGEGANGFTDVSFKAGTAASSLPYVGWGTAFLDYDNDGLQDIIAVNGHVYPQLDHALLAASAPYKERKLLYHNLGGGHFEEVAAQYGPVMMEPRVSRGLAIGDLDNDGRLDLVINDLDGKAQILHNEYPNPGNWLLVKLKGRSPNTDAIGALVTARTKKGSQLRLVRSGTSYLSQDDMRQHFGLGQEALVDSLEVQWPDGTTSVMKDVRANQIVEVRQK
jgi:hypothetical protein